MVTGGSHFCFALMLLGVCLPQAQAQQPGVNQPGVSADASKSVNLPFLFLRQEGLSQIVIENNRRGVKILSGLIDQGAVQDQVVSPIGMTAVNLLLLSGLSGELENRFASSMGLSNCSSAQIRERTQSLIQSVKSNSPQNELTAAIIVGSALRLNPEYVEFLNRLGVLSASSSAAADVNKIERLLSKETRGKYNAISLPPADGITFISSDYFKGTWLSKFLIDNTRPQDFHSVNGSVCKVQMMQKWFQFPIPFLRGDHFRAIRLPFESSTSKPNMLTHGLYLVLPDDGVEFTQFVRQFAKNGFERYGAKWQAKTGTLSMPRFKIESNLDIPVTKEEGDSLNIEGADLHRLCVAREKVRTVKVKQKLTVEVNENGTEAVAVTECMMSLGARPDVFHLNVNRPFIFLLVDDRTGAIIFAGSVVRPQDSKPPFEIAEKQWKEAVESAKRRESNFASGNGKLENIWYLLALQRFADFYRKESKPERAEAILVEASRICQDTELQATTLDALAQLYISLKRYQDANKLYQQLLAIQKRESISHGSSLMESRTANYVKYLEHYTSLLELMGQSRDEPRKEQERIFKDDLQRSRSSLADCRKQDEHYVYNSTASAEFRLAKFYNQAGKKAEAEKFFQSGIATALKSSSPDYTLLYQSGSEYAVLLNQQHKEEQVTAVNRQLTEWKNLAKLDQP